MLILQFQIIDIEIRIGSESNADDVLNVHSRMYTATELKIQSQRCVFKRQTLFYYTDANRQHMETHYAISYRTILGLDVSFECLGSIFN